MCDYQLSLKSQIHAFSDAVILSSPCAETVEKPSREHVIVCSPKTSTVGAGVLGPHGTTLEVWLVKPTLESLVGFLFTPFEEWD